MFFDMLLKLFQFCLSVKERPPYFVVQKSSSNDVIFSIEKIQEGFSANKTYT